MNASNHTKAPAPLPPTPGKRRLWIYLILGLLLVGLAGFSLQVGNYHVPAERTLKLFVSWLGGTVEPHSSDYSDVVVLKLRLPRIIMVLLVGATLGMTGCVSHLLFRNPADP